MPSPIRLPRIEGITQDVDNIIDRYCTAIERALNVSAEAPLEVSIGQNGVAFRMGPLPGAKWARTTSGGISAASGDTLGSGDVVLRDRDGATLTDGATVKCYSNFTVAITHPRRLLVVPDQGDWALAGADCPP